jgi:hypothetical protein
LCAVTVWKADSGIRRDDGCGGGSLLLLFGLLGCEDDCWPGPCCCCCWTWGRGTPYVVSKEMSSCFGRVKPSARRATRSSW